MTEKRPSCPIPSKLTLAYSAAEGFYSVEVIQEAESKKAIGLKVEAKEVQSTWAELTHGAYLLRTNCSQTDPVLVWKRYVQLTQAEEAFRISKSDLHLRLFFHQKTERVEAHILEHFKYLYSQTCKLIRWCHKH